MPTSKDRFTMAPMLLVKEDIKWRDRSISSEGFPYFFTQNLELQLTTT